MSERGSVPSSLAHLTESAVEQLADGLLKGRERELAEAHVEVCATCTGRLEASRALIEALSALPRFAPTPDFSDLVMANIQIAPRASPVLAWIRHWTPATRRGWMMLVAALLAPMLPLLGLTIWVATSPVLTAGSVVQWTMHQGRSLAVEIGSTATRWGMQMGVPGWAEGLFGFLQGIPLDALVFTLVILAVAIPLSAWSLVRLVRTPTGNVTYAN